MARDEQGALSRPMTAALVALVVLAAVLRLGWLERPVTLFPDEAYSAWVASLPAGDLVREVADTDPHPPLSYLLLRPVVALTQNEAALRLPSALCSVAAVALLAWELRRRGIEALVATALFAVLPFALFYGRQVRMYGLLQLCGVVGAVAARRWLLRPARSSAAVAAVAGAVAAFTHVTGPGLLLALALVPGRRGDRLAWVWRAGLGGALLLFALLWGPNLLRWWGVRDSTVAHAATVVINESVVAVPSQAPVVLTLLVAGVVVAVRRRDDWSRVIVSLYVVPVVALMIVSVRSALLQPKTLVLFTWAVPVSVAALVGALARWRPLAGAVVVVVVAALTLPFVPVVLNPTPSEHILERLREVVRPGDVVAGHPDDNVLRWYVFRDPEGRLRPAPPLPLSDTTTAKVGDAPFSGRVWLVDSTYIADPLTVDRPACAPPEVLPERRQLRCVEFAP